MVLNIWATPTANQALYAGDVSFLVGGRLNVTTSGIVDVWLVDVDQVPVRSPDIVALVLQGALSEHHADRVLAYLLIVGQGVLHLPLGAVCLLGRCLGVVAVVVTRELELRYRSTLASPEALLCTPSEVILQVVPQLQID